MKNKTKKIAKKAKRALNCRNPANKGNDSKTGVNMCMKIDLQESTHSRIVMKVKFGKRKIRLINKFFISRNPS